jgi:hypothetical protein
MAGELKESTSKSKVVTFLGVGISLRETRRDYRK